MENNNLKPIVQLKVLSHSLMFDSDSDTMIESLKNVSKQLKEEGYIPIISTDTMDFSILQPDDIIAHVINEPITVRNLLDVYYKNQATSTITNNDILTAVDNVFKIKKYIDDINNLIQLVYPDDTTGEEIISSKVVLDEGWKEEAALRNNIAYSIQSNNTNFAKLVNDLMTELEEEKTQEDGVKTDLLSALDEYLQTYLATQSDDNQYRPVSIGEIVDSYKQKDDETSEESEATTEVTE